MCAEPQDEKKVEETVIVSEKVVEEKKVDRPKKLIEDDDSDDSDDDVPLSELYRKVNSLSHSGAKVEEKKVEEKVEEKEEEKEQEKVEEKEEEEMDAVENLEDTPITVRMEISQSSVDDDDDDEQAPDKVQDVSFSWFCEDLKVFFQKSNRLYRRDGDSKEQGTHNDLELDDKSVRVLAKTSPICAKDRASVDILIKLLLHSATYEHLKALNSARFSIWAVHPSKKHGQKTEHLWTYRFNDKEKRFESIRMLVDVSEREIRLITNLEEDCVISTPLLRPGSCFVLAADETFSQWIHDSCPSLDPVFEITLDEELSQDDDSKQQISCLTPERTKKGNSSSSWREKQTNSPEF